MNPIFFSWQVRRDSGTSGFYLVIVFEFDPTVTIVWLMVWFALWFSFVSCYCCWLMGWLCPMILLDLLDFYMLVIIEPCYCNLAHGALTQTRDTTYTPIRKFKKKMEDTIRWDRFQKMLKKSVFSSYDHVHVYCTC